MVQETLQGAWDTTAVRIQESAHQGRYVVAAKALLPWQLLLEEVPPILVAQGAGAEDEVVKQLQSNKGGLGDQLCATSSLLHPAETTSVPVRQLYSNSFLHLDDAPLDQDDGCQSMVEYVALYHEVSLMNHSCAPNAVLQTEFETVNGARTCKSRVFNIRPVEEGEEICIAYQILMKPTAQRQEVFLQRYGFKCCCPRCQDAESKDPERIARSGETMLGAQLSEEDQNKSVTRRVMAVKKSSVYHEDVGRWMLSRPDVAVQSQSFHVLWSTVMKFEETPREVNGKQIVSVALKLPMWPLTNHELHELRDVFVNGAISLDPPPVDGMVAGTRLQYLNAIKAHHTEVVRNYFRPYISTEKSDAAANAALLEKALCVLVPGYSRYSV